MRDKIEHILRTFNCNFTSLSDCLTNIMEEYKRVDMSEQEIKKMVETFGKTYVQQPLKDSLYKSIYEQGIYDTLKTLKNEQAKD